MQSTLDGGARMKKIGVGAHIGDSGVALIHQMVNKMGHEAAWERAREVEARRRW